MQQYYSIQNIAGGVYRIISSEGSHTEVIVGSHHAALIDTGVGFGNLKAAVASITTLPLLVFNTHCHIDHIGANAQFDAPVYMGEEDIPYCEYTNSRSFRQIMMDRCAALPEGFDREEFLSRGAGRLMPCHEGDVFDLGGKSLCVYNASGHSLGGRVYLLEKEGFLYTGDEAYPCTLVFGYGTAGRKAHIDTLNKLCSLPFTAIYGSHALTPMNMDDLRLYLRAAREVTYENGVPFPNCIRDGEDARTCCLPGMTPKDEGKPGFAALVLSSFS